MSFYDEKNNSIEWINMEDWNRAKLFNYYLGTDFPYIVITANIDVTKPLAFARKHGISFNLVMVYLCNKMADSIPNYRYRFVDGKPFMIDHTRPLVNHIVPGNDIFVIGEGPWPCDDIVEFCKKTHEAQMKAEPVSLSEVIGSNIDIINYTSVPWVQYTGFIRTVIHDGLDNAPKISFGKYFTDPTDPSKTWMPLSNQTHHGLMDGSHVGRFYNGLQQACNELEV